MQDMQQESLMGIPHTREPWWKFMLARLFGKKRIGVDHVEDGQVFIMEGYMWRGRLYICKYHVEVDPSYQKPLIPMRPASGNSSPVEPESAEVVPGCQPLEFEEPLAELEAEPLIAESVPRHLLPLLTDAGRRGRPQAD